MFSDLEIVPDHEPVFKQAPKDFGKNGCFSVFLLILPSRSFSFVALLLPLVVVRVLPFIHNASTVFQSKGTPPPSVKTDKRSLVNQRNNCKNLNCLYFFFHIGCHFKWGVVANYFNFIYFVVPVQTSTGSIFTLECVQPNKACWTQPPSPVQLEKVRFIYHETCLFIRRSLKIL